MYSSVISHLSWLIYYNPVLFKRTIYLDIRLMMMGYLLIFVMWFNFSILISGNTQVVDYDEGNWDGFGEGQSVDDGIMDNEPLFQFTLEECFQDKIL